jgi:hypothetical protein
MLAQGRSGPLRADQGTLKPLNSAQLLYWLCCGTSAPSHCATCALMAVVASHACGCLTTACSGVGGVDGWLDVGLAKSNGDRATH